MSLHYPFKTVGSGARKANKSLDRMAAMFLTKILVWVIYELSSFLTEKKLEKIWSDAGCEKKEKSKLSNSCIIFFVEAFLTNLKYLDWH
jgi:hypothetical protein